VRSDPPDDDFDEAYDDEERPRRRIGPLKVAFIGLVCGVALSFGAILTAFSTGTGAGAPGALTILMMGTDQRPDERGSDPGRTDSMMLVVVRPNAPVALVSVPRDLWVSIPGYGEGRINTAYRSAELERPGSGPAEAKTTVAAALGIHVDRYVLVDMAGLRTIVDDVGGVDVDVPTTIIDQAFPTDDYGITTIEIPAGRQHLNGAMALAYARTRHQDSDFGRMGRQQQVIEALMAKLARPSGMLAAPRVLRAVSAATRSDLSPADAAFLAAGGVLAGGGVRQMVIGPELVSPLTGDDGAALLQPRPGLKAAVADFVELASPRS